jgi:aminomethyltransferase
MKKTTLTDFHIALGAKMHEFAGFICRSYIRELSTNICGVNSVGVFDVSHMGEFGLMVQSRLILFRKYRQRCCFLSVGKAQYTCFVNVNGGIIDDFLLYHYEPEKYMLVVNAANIEKDWAWCQKQNTMGAEIENASDHTAQLAVQGPKAKDTLQKLTDVDLSSIPYYSFVTGEIAGCGQCHYFQHRIHRAGGFELYFYPSSETDWNAIFDAGKEFGIKLPAWEQEIHYVWKWAFASTVTISTIRQRRYSRIGVDNEICGWIIFQGRERLEAEKAAGIPRKLCGFTMIDKGIPRHDMQIGTSKMNDRQRNIGHHVAV